MCVGIPARIIDVQGTQARCESRDGLCMVDLSLTGTLAPGTWVLTFLGAAREVIDAERARDVNTALDALDAIARGQTDVDAYFSDQTGDHEPMLPEHLRVYLPKQVP